MLLLTELFVRPATCLYRGSTVYAHCIELNCRVASLGRWHFCLTYPEGAQIVSRTGHRLSRLIYLRFSSVYPEIFWDITTIKSWPLTYRFFATSGYACIEYKLTDWLADWLAGWLTDWMTGWLDDWLTSWLVDWLTSWLTDWLAGWLTDSLADWMTGWLVDWLTSWLTDWLADWLAEWLAGWLTDWLAGWLTGWLNDWLAGWLTD